MLPENMPMHRENPAELSFRGVFSVCFSQLHPKNEQKNSEERFLVAEILTNFGRAKVLLLILLV